MKEKIKRIFSIAIFPSITLLLLVRIFTPVSVQAVNIVDGDLIKNPNAPGEAQFDVYIVKIAEEKRFKRLILSPHVFESYGHLSWDKIKDVDQATMDEYKTSDLVRCYDPGRGVDGPKVYKLTPEGDTGTKQWLNITAEEFESAGHDWNSVYIINRVDRDVYSTGEEITFSGDTSCSTVTYDSCQYCSEGDCLNYCQGTNSSCGCINCINCNDLDGCFEDNYRDYYCSGTSCTYTSDDCSDCSCSCGGYNIEESIKNGNCEDGKDNDCDGLTDLVDPGCANKNENCHVGSLWSQDYCTSNCKCKAGEGDCNSDADCETGYCAQGAGERYSQPKWVDVCEERPYLKILSPREGEELEKGKAYLIKWDFRGAKNTKIYIKLLLDYNPRLIKSDISPSITEYYWTIPSDVTAGNLYRIEVGRDDGQANDTTDYFQIIGKNIPCVQTLPIIEFSSGMVWLQGEIKEAENGLFAPRNFWGSWGCRTWFEWGETPSLGNETPHQGSFNKEGLAVLSQNTTYYYRAIVGCNDGVNYGEIKSFTTESAHSNSTFRPAIFISSVKKITPSSAVLNLQIGDLEDGETYIRDVIETWIEWGESNSLGNKTSPTLNVLRKPGDVGYDPWNSKFPVFREVSIVGLSPGTTYYFRVVAKNSVGISYGEIESFTTKSQE